MSLASRLVYARRGPFARVVKELLALYGIEFPAAAEVGRGLIIAHRGFGLVVHPNVTIGRDVVIYQGVTIGASNPWDGPRAAGHIVIGDGVTLCAGAKVLVRSGETLRIADGVTVGANAVLTRSIDEPGDVWVGVPARPIGTRGYTGSDVTRG